MPHSTHNRLHSFLQHAAPSAGLRLSADDFTRKKERAKNRTASRGVLANLIERLHEKCAEREAAGNVS